MGDYLLSVQGLCARRAGSTLDQVDLDVKRGASVALIGAPRAGKSLLLACIAGAARASSGRIRYCGYELRHRPQTLVVRMGIARTHQTPASFGAMRVLETVTVGALLRRPNIASASAAAREMLALTGLSDRATAPFDELTMCERRQLELARALATQPQLLLLDDLGADLQSAQLAALRRVLDDVRGLGMTIVAAARSAAACPATMDTVITLADGTTVAKGSYATADI